MPITIGNIPVVNFIIEQGDDCTQPLGIVLSTGRISIIDI